MIGVGAGARWRAVGASPVLYLTIVVLSLLLAFGYKVRTESIFACPASGYGSEDYLAYCQTTGYGDYDHGAFWFGMEPDAQRAAADADVLFLGNSRMQFAFSTEATTRWFASSASLYYLLGFSYGENAQFEAPLLERLKPRALAYVINVDRFFDDGMTMPADSIQHHASEAQSNYEEKRFWQHLHKRACTTVPALCGHEIAFFRSRNSGAWELRGTEDFKATFVSDENAQVSDRDHWAHYAALGDEFIRHLPVDRRCVVLTIAPWQATKIAEARAIADALKIELIAPQVPGLRTIDGDHLDRASAEKWSASFFEAAGPRLQQCLRTGHAATRS